MNFQTALLLKSKHLYIQALSAVLKALALWSTICTLYTNFMKEGAILKALYWYLTLDIEKVFCFSS